MVNSLIDLPLDILSDILARLPLKSIVTAKCVCKTFVNLIFSPNSGFTVLYSVNAAQVVISLHGRSLHVLEPRHDNDIGFRFARLWQTPICELPDWISISNSCNGLLYFIHTHHGGDMDSLVCNPFTSEYLVIPGKDDEGHKDDEFVNMWLGFSPSSHQYKILKILRGADKVAEGRLLEVGSISNSWRAIEGSHTHPTPSIGGCVECPIFLDGVIYWSVSYGFVDFFDFEREEFGKLELPRHFVLAYGSFINFGILQNCLCLFVNDCTALEMWIMEKRSNNQIDWSMKYEVDMMWYANILKADYGRISYVNLLKLFGRFSPVQVLSNEEILMVSRNNDIVCFNPKTESSRVVGRSSKCVSFVGSLIPTFVSLKDILKVDSNAIVTKNRFNLDMLKRDNTNDDNKTLMSE